MKVSRSRFLAFRTRALMIQTKILTTVSFPTSHNVYTAESITRHHSSKAQPWRRSFPRPSATVHIWILSSLLKAHSLTFNSKESAMPVRDIPSGSRLGPAQLTFWATEPDLAKDDA